MEARPVVAATAAADGWDFLRIPQFWEPMHCPGKASVFSVRGPKYLSDKRKMPAGARARRDGVQAGPPGSVSGTGASILCRPPCTPTCWAEKGAQRQRPPWSRDLVNPWLAVIVVAVAAPTGNTMYFLHSCELVSTPGPQEHVSRFLPSVRGNPAAFSLVVNLMIPGACVDSRRRHFHGLGAAAATAAAPTAPQLPRPDAMKRQYDA